MAGEIYITAVGRLTADPELRFTPNGGAVANFTVASNPRKFDRQANDWVDGTATFWRCEAWTRGKLQLAENVAESLRKGSPVVVYGELRSREYETRDGEKRTATELHVIAVGPDLSWASTNPQQPRNETTNTTSDPAWGDWGTN